MDPILKNVVRVGIVSKVNPEACSARVVFQDRSDVVSYELPILVRGSLNNKDYWLPDPGEQVVCLFLPSGNAQGFILGTVYSKKDKPPVTDSNKRYVVFEDGTVAEYDKSAHKLLLDVKGTIEIKVAENLTINVTGPVNITVSENANVTAKTASISAQETMSISAPKGVSISATDPEGSGVTIAGKDLSEGW